MAGNFLFSSTNLHSHLTWIFKVHCVKLSSTNNDQCIKMGKCMNSCDAKSLELRVTKKKIGIEAIGDILWALQMAVRIYKIRPIILSTGKNEVDSYVASSAVTLQEIWRELKPPYA